MAILHNTATSLRFFGDDLDPEKVTAMLGKDPTTCEKKGQTIKNHKTGNERIARKGKWLLSADRRSPGDLDGQITEIMNGMTDDLEVWNTLADSFQADIFCGLFMAEKMEGLSISPQTLKLLGDRGLPLGMTIYSSDMD